MTKSLCGLRKLAGLIVSLAIILQSSAPAFAAAASEASARSGRSTTAAPQALRGFSAPLDAPAADEGVMDVTFSPDDLQRFAELAPVKVETVDAPPVARQPAEKMVEELREKGVDLSGQTPDHVVAEQLRAAAEQAPAGSPLRTLVAMADSIVTAGAGAAAKAGAYYDDSKPVMAEDIKDIVTSKEFKALEKIAYPKEDPAKAEESSNGSWWSGVARLLAPAKKELSKAEAVAKLEAMFGTADASKFELKASDLRWNAPEEKLAVPEKTPEDVNPIVGQERAIEAVRFAVRMPDNHHHLFVAGAEQAGASDLVNFELSQYAPSQPTPFDRVLVTNFSNPDSPLILDLPPGSAPTFKQNFDGMVQQLKMALPIWLNHPQTQMRRAHMEASLYQSLQELIDENFQPAFVKAFPGLVLGIFGQKLAVVSSERGPQIQILPVIGTTVVTPENQAQFIANARFNKEDLARFQKEARAAAKPILQRLQKLATRNFEKQLSQFQAQETSNLLTNGDPQSEFPSIHETLMMIVTNGHHSFEGDEKHVAWRASVEQRHKELEQKLAGVKVGDFGVELVNLQTPMGDITLLTFSHEGFPNVPTAVGPEELEKAVAAGAMSAEQAKAISETIAQHGPELEALNQEVMQTLAQDKEEHQAIHKEAETGLSAAEIRAGKRAEQYLYGVVQALAAMHQAFLPKPDAPKGTMSLSDAMAMMGGGDAADRFKVSILSSNNEAGAPIVNVPKHATLEEVMGIILTPVQEMMSPSGMPVSMRSPGSVGVRSGLAQQSFGGHLVFDAWHYLTTPGLHAAISEMVQTEVATIKEGGIKRMFGGGRELKIPWKGQVTIIGSPWLLNVLQRHDPSFKKHFQVIAQMDSRIDVNDRTLEGFANFIRRQLDLQKQEELQLAIRTKLEQDAPPATSAEEKLIEPEAGGVAALFEHGMRSIERNEEITAQWGALRDIWQEASHIAREAKHEKVTREDVEKAISDRQEREAGYKERVLDMHAKDIMHLQLHGTQVGQTNALTIYGGLDGFGSGSRTTVSKALVGQVGVTDIENGVQWTDETYKKGSLSINARLTAMFAKDRFGNFRRFPFLLTSSKEQLYGGIGGDSSTSTKDYAGLSQLSEIGIQQSIAMTGSMSQFGDVQPIGGANLKIEGWFDFVIARLKLEGKELTKELGAGVIIPASNAKDLMLRKDIVKSVEEGKFHIWTVRRDAEGISILTKKAIGWILYQADRMIDAAYAGLRGASDKKESEKN